MKTYQVFSMKQIGPAGIAGEATALVPPTNSEITTIEVLSAQTPAQITNALITQTFSDSQITQLLSTIYTGKGQDELFQLLPFVRSSNDMLGFFNTLSSGQAYNLALVVPGAMKQSQIQNFVDQPISTQRSQTQALLSKIQSNSGSWVDVANYVIQSEETQVANMNQPETITAWFSPSSASGTQVGASILEGLGHFAI